MIVEIIPPGGLGKVTPLVLPASQIVVKMDDGTAIMVAACYGPDGAVAVASVQHNEAEFNQTLLRLGIKQTTIVHRIPKQQALPGARLVAGPGVH